MPCIYRTIGYCTPLPVLLEIRISHALHLPAPKPPVKPNEICASTPSDSTQDIRRGPVSVHDCRGFRTAQASSNPDGNRGTYVVVAATSWLVLCEQEELNAVADLIPAPLLQQFSLNIEFYVVRLVRVVCDWGEGGGVWC